VPTPKETNVPIDPYTEQLSQRKKLMELAHATQLHETRQTFAPKQANKSKQKKKPPSSSPKKLSTNPKQPSTVQQIKSMTDDEALDSILDNKAKCHFLKCKTSTELLGSICQHCKEQYCYSHSLPEVHGCGEAAKQHARSEWKKENPFTPESDRPPKPLKEWERKHLQNKLHKKIASARPKKQAPKKKK